MKVLVQDERLYSMEDAYGGGFHGIIFFNHCPGARLLVGRFFVSSKMGARVKVRNDLFPAKEFNMYIPKLYREEDRQGILAFLQQNNFPAIVTYDGERPLATHGPVEVLENENGLTIYGHMARANPQWKTMPGQEVLFIFQGAHTYISPRWYNHVNVPTWNYKIVHVYGRVRELQGEHLYALLSRLVEKHESSSSYRLEGLPQDFVQKEMKAVFGFAADVTRLDAGYKLSQNRNDEDHANIIEQLAKRGDENSHEIARSMREQRGRSNRR